MTCTNLRFDQLYYITYINVAVHTSSCWLVCRSQTRTVLSVDPLISFLPQTIISHTRPYEHQKKLLQYRNALKRTYHQPCVLQIHLHNGQSQDPRSAKYHPNYHCIPYCLTDRVNLHISNNMDHGSAPVSCIHFTALRCPKNSRTTSPA